MIKIPAPLEAAMESVGIVDAIAEKASPHTHARLTYIVQYGDTLTAIAQRFGILDWCRIARVNRLNTGKGPDWLEAGWQLIIPPKILTSRPGNTATQIACINVARESAAQKDP